MNEKESNMNLNNNSVEEVLLPPKQPDLRTDCKYSEEDILLLIKFIIKEFGKTIQKWFFKDSFSQSIFGINASPQISINQFFLNLLLNKKNLMKQQQENFTQNLPQPLDSKQLSTILNQIQYLSGNSTPSNYNPINSNASNRESVIIENQNSLNNLESNNQETKCEVNTMQSSEEKLIERSILLKKIARGRN